MLNFVDPLTAEKRDHAIAQQNSTSRTQNDSVDDCSLDSIMNGFSNVIQFSKLEEIFY